jgi:hypothetical protein
MSMSAFGVDHGISKALTSVVRTPFKTSENAQILANKIGRLKPTSGAHERALNMGRQRAGALAGRATHRENYPGSKKLNGFPRKALP